MNTETLFKETPVWKAIASMCIPAVITMLVMVLYNMADLYFIAQTQNHLMIAAVSLASPLFTLLMALGTLLGSGGCTAIAQAFGAGKKENAKKYSCFCALSSLVLGILMSILIFIFLDPFLMFLGCDASTYSFTKEYIVVLLLASPAILFTNAFANIVRGEGSVKESMIANGIATLVNILLDPILISMMKMGVQGAAIATALGNVAGCLYLLKHIRKSELLSCSPKDLTLTYQEAFHIFELGIPSAVSNVMLSFATTFQNQMLAIYGAGVITSMSVANKATMVVAMVAMGICIGVQPLMAYNYGALDVKRSKEILKDTALTSLFSAIILASLCYWGKDVLVSLFLQDPQMIEMSTHILIIHLLSAPFLGLFYVGVNFLQASGNTRSATFISMTRQGIVFIPILFLMNALAGLEGLIYAVLCAEILSCLLSVIFCIKQYRKFKLQTKMQIV